MLLSIKPKNSLITIKEARKLLGDKTKNLTNGELETLIIDTETVVRIFVRQYISSKNIENSAKISPEGR